MSEPTRQWFHDDEFHEELPEEVSAAVAQFYGNGQIGSEFAQMLASFLLHQGGGTKGSHPDDPGWVLIRRNECHHADHAEVVGMEGWEALWQCKRCGRWGFPDNDGWGRGWRDWHPGLGATAPVHSTTTPKCAQCDRPCGPGLALKITYGDREFEFCRWGCLAQWAGDAAMAHRAQTDGQP